MAFDQNLLADLVERAFKTAMSVDQPEPGSPPNVSRVAASALATAYGSYVLANVPALAPITFASPPTVTPVHVQIMTAPMLSGWGPFFVAFWTPVLLVVPGLVPGSPVEPLGLSARASALSSGVAAMMGAFSPTMRLAAEKLAVLLHTATIGMTFIGVTLVGVPTPVSLL